ncbi:MAG: L,D-transpeptidase [Bacteroidetes bacterium]|nr:L,D-transpeptidase [Bacteroidota bacterium]MBL6944505.1 L,D-transpeptidase [Bacteroidales bacterium]
MKKLIFIFLPFIVVLLMVVAYILFWMQVPPISEISKARITLSEADKIKSLKYASKLFQNASMYYDSAMINWNIENEKFIMFRDYKKVKENAEKSTKLAVEAIAKTKNSLSSAEELLAIKISRLESRIKEFNNKYGNFPFKSKERNELIKSKLILNEGILAYNQAKYMSSRTKLDSAETLINALHEIYEERLEDYFSQYPQWKEWIDQSIYNSKKNKSYCIIVDKYARECILYKNGIILQKLKIELGPNWIGDKNQQGDKSTPEGLYKIVSKKSKGATKYYKAFLLDYPNEDDKKRFLLGKKNGIIKQDAKIGNLIEIHGNGGKGVDWTDGCVALTNTDMDSLYSVCPEGTRVTIVGSVVSLKELFLD